MMYLDTFAKTVVHSSPTVDMMTLQMAMKKLSDN